MIKLRFLKRKTFFLKAHSALHGANVFSFLFFFFWRGGWGGVELFKQTLQPFYDVVRDWVDACPPPPPSLAQPSSVPAPKCNFSYLL